MFDSDVKMCLGLEIKGILNNKNIEEIVNLYEAVIYFSNGSDNGVSLELAEAISDYFLQKGNIRQIHKTIVNIEPFLKKLLKMINPQEYYDLTNECALAKTMTILKLKDRCSVKNLNTEVEKITDPVSRAIVKSYQIRNTTSHDGQIWSHCDMAENIRDVLVTSCCAVWDNKISINVALEKEERKQYDFQEYVKKIINEYEKKSKEGFKYVPLIWETGQNGNLSNMKFNEEEIHKKDDKKVLFLGEAGCGKTTILDNLEYIDAINFKNKKTNIIPIKINLFEENYNYQTIEEMICEKVKIPYDTCIRFLEQGMINLYLDGVNEIIASDEIRKKVAISIEKLSENYPKTFIVVTDRPHTIVKVHFTQIFKLRKMGRDDVLTYAKAQPLYNAFVEDKMQEMLDMEKYKAINYTPLFINQLVLIFSMGKPIPQNEYDLLDNYLQTLFDREYIEKKDENAAPGRLDLILTELVKLDGMENGTSYSQVLRFVSSVIQQYGLTIKAEGCLNLAFQLGILTKQGNDIRFYSEEYFSYFFEKSLGL